VLIPKKHVSIQPKDFRPISLIHAIQRIFFKILSTIIQPIIQSLISPNQTGFLHGRLITEIFLFAQQLLHYTNKNNEQEIIFKADIHKVFDTLN
jgi:retron-type reverse transcriptase